MQVIYSISHTCAVVGKPFPCNEDAVKAKIAEILKSLNLFRGISHFISDLSPGPGLWVAECVFELRRKRPNLTIEAAIPYEEQHVNWDGPDCERYFNAVEKCTSQRLVNIRQTDRWREDWESYLLNNTAVILGLWQDGTQPNHSFAFRAKERDTDFFNYYHDNGSLILHKG